MDTTLPDRLLDYLRQTLGAAIGYAAAPARLNGGFDTTILAFSLAGAPADWQGGLILRLMAHPRLAGRVRREAATHDALTGAGFAAPRVLRAEPDPAPLGRPFLIMRRLAGGNMGAGGPASILRAPRVLATAQAALHRVPAAALRESARRHGVDPAIFTLEGEVRRLAARIAESGLSGLSGLGAGAAWLVRHRPPPAEAEVICHGDYHPFNVMLDGKQVSGVIDWSQAILAEPAFDVAATRVVLRFPYLGEPRWARWPFGLARTVFLRSYTRAYRAARPFEERNLGYFEAMRVLHALAVAGETPPSPRDPWNQPHTLAALYRHFETISGVRVRI
ncbi:MAG: phosphotransferase [Alphaproteobacteria bacterium]|nr:phosphotransferase [Alphaproteobacteria bacterium]MCW5742231.1 phosphotransferase [Alphaproteobacteria bacterium]